MISRAAFCAKQRNRQQRELQAMDTSMNARHWPRSVALVLIRFYQTRISPLTPPACRFHPTCSHYTYEAIERFGFARGILLGAIRICNCYPLHMGGLDLVPEEFALFQKLKVRSNSTVLPKSSHDTSES
jgi:putative membrane protein insertion efficiency factor